MRVETLEEHHRKGLRLAAADPEIFRFMPYPGDFDRWFDEALAPSDDIAFTVIAGGREVGSTRFLRIAFEHLRAEIGWTWLERAVWQTGVNVETKLLLLEHAFERCGLRRVEFKTDARNERSRGALLALGTRFEGVFRKHMVLLDGSPRDSAWYSVVDDDWPEVKAGLLRRLETAG